jgi:hypothetical protein
MFSDRFSSIIDRMPSNRQALAQIAQYLDAASAQNRLQRLRLDPRRIQQIGGIDSGLELAEVISVLIRERVLRRVIVVESPAGGAVAEYASYEDVPETIHDHLRDTWMNVTPSDIKAFYLAVN